MNAFATAISIGLQYGVPLETFVRKFSYMRFDPEGMTTNPEIPFAKSLPDYIMRWLASRFLDPEVQEELGILTRGGARAQEGRGGRRRRPTARQRPLGQRRDDGNGPNGGAEAAARRVRSRRRPPSPTHRRSTRPARGAGPRSRLLPVRRMMQRTGSCYTCSSCGNNTGCGWSRRSSSIQTMKAFRGGPGHSRSI